MGQNQCVASVKGGLVYTKDTVTGIMCCGRRSSKMSVKKGGRAQYGAMGSASGKYDDSDDEQSCLYSSNLLLDDDDEEEQIVIITNPNKNETASQRAGPAQQRIDQSVFRDGKGLLDMSSPARPQQQYDFVSPPQQHSRAAGNNMRNMQSSMEQDQNVADVMNEIDDHLDDSDGEDSSYLVNANSGTGGAETQGEQLAKSYIPEEKQYQANEYDAYTYPDNQSYNTTATGGYDNYSNQHNSGVPEQDYQSYAQSSQNEYNNQGYNQPQTNEGAWQPQWENQDYSYSNKQQTAEDLMAELDDAAGSDENDGLL